MLAELVMTALQLTAYDRWKHCDVLLHLYVQTIRRVIEEHSGLRADSPITNDLCRLEVRLLLQIHNRDLLLQQSLLRSLLLLKQ